MVSNKCIHTMYASIYLLLSSLNFLMGMNTILDLTPIYSVLRTFTYHQGKGKSKLCDSSSILEMSGKLYLKRLVEKGDVTILFFFFFFAPNKLNFCM